MWSVALWVVVLFLIGVGLLNFLVRKVPPSQSWLYFATAFSMVALLGTNYEMWYRVIALALSIICLMRSLSLRGHEKNIRRTNEGGASGTQETAKNLRIEAGRLRMSGRFDDAYDKYKRANAIYEKLGDKDNQCNVLCSMAETTPYNEIPEILAKIEAICASIADSEEKTKAFHNLDALKERLRTHNRI
jgi:hypothetical protein